MSQKRRRYRDMNPRVAVVMRDLYFIGKIKQTELARMFGKRQGSVSRVVSGRVWQ